MTADQTADRSVCPVTIIPGPGAYFVTICTQDRRCLFGDIVEREMEVNDAGRMVDKWCRELENRFPNIKCDKYTIMPNHFHAIIQNAVGADLCVVLKNKGFVAHAAGEFPVGGTKKLKNKYRCLICEYQKKM
jgi:REP element-mobilizing transposase RayT